MPPRRRSPRTVNGAAIRAIREAVGINQANFATQVRVSAPFLCNIEAGRSQPSPEVARRIADALGVELAAIVDLGCPCKADAS